MASPKSSWWLKLDRAEKHLVDLETEIARYAHRQPYRVEQVHPGRNRGTFAFRIRFTEQPDSDLKLILGDAIHNTRSALDHLAVALVPSNRRDTASFPILMQDLWALDETGEFIVSDYEARPSFERDVRGMNPEATALILEMQPFRIGDQAPQDALGILSRLENADKHRKLSSLEPGVQDGYVVAKARGTLAVQPAPGFRHDGTEVANFSWPTFTPPLRQSEVNVQIYGPVVIGVKSIGQRGYTNVAEFRRTILPYLREDIIPALERFVRRK